MKKTNFILLLSIILTLNFLNAQNKKESKFSIIGYGGIGHAIIKNDSLPNYNLNINNSEFVLNYKIKNNIGIATGIGINQLSGNGFNSMGNFYHERTLLKIPIQFTLLSNISEKINIFTNFGLYGQNIIQDKYHFLNNTQRNVYEGWNFGAQFGIGFMFKMIDKFSLGINYMGQSDFNKFKSNNSFGVYDKQKIKNLNSVGIILMIKL